MSGKDEREERARPRLKLLYCPRVGRQIELTEHEQCPYCYGTLTEIRRGVRAEFCDYKPDVDPVNFGFPDDEVRHLSG